MWCRNIPFIVLNLFISVSRQLFIRFLKDFFFSLNCVLHFVSLCMLIIVIFCNKQSRVTSRGLQTSPLHKALNKRKYLSKAKEDSIFLKRRHTTNTLLTVLRNVGFSFLSPPHQPLSSSPSFSFLPFGLTWPTKGFLHIRPPLKAGVCEKMSKYHLRQESVSSRECRHCVSSWANAVTLRDFLFLHHVPEIGEGSTDSK